MCGHARAYTHFLSLSLPPENQMSCQKESMKWVLAWISLHHGLLGPAKSQMCIVRALALLSVLTPMQVTHGSFPLKSVSALCGVKVASGEVAREAENGRWLGKSGRV